MAIASLTAYQDRMAAPTQRLQDTKVSLTTIAGRLSSLWVTLPDAGNGPVGAVAPTRATIGAMGQQNAAVAQRIAQLAVSIGNGGYLMIADRLSHQGGLSGIVTTAQTTNLPTAALTRATSGVGVWAALEIYGAVGTTATTVTCTYTNSDGVGGRISQATVFGGTGFREVGRVIVMPVQAGDAGVRSVEDVTVLASTATAGSFGVTLFKPLTVYPLPNLGSQQFLIDAVLNLCACLPVVPDDACLFYLLNANTTSSGVLLTANRFIED
jgi:hypothetical protein